MIAQRETVGRALRHHLEQQLAVDAGATADGERLGERLDRDEQHHVVEDLDRLPGTDRAAMGDLAAHAGKQRPHRLEQIGRAAHHDAERAVMRRLPGARHRRIEEADVAFRELTRELAHQLRRAGAHVDDRVRAAARLRDAAVAQAHRLDLGAARQ